MAPTPTPVGSPSGASQNLAEPEEVAALLFGRDDEAKVNAAKQISDLIAHPGWQHMRKAWGIRIQREIQLMTVGGFAHPHDHAQYAQIAGRIHGLTLAADLAAGLVKVGDRIRERRDKEAQEATNER